MKNKRIFLQGLNRTTFAPFGDVIECEDRESIAINQGLTERYHALSVVQASGDGAQVAISMFRNVSMTRTPFSIHMLERHPYGSQSFIPLARQQFIIIVALTKEDDQPDEDEIYAFMSNGLQGVTYRQGIWHHPLISLEMPSDFLVVDRIGQGSNCDVYPLTAECVISA